MLKWSSLGDESTRRRFIDEFGAREIAPDRLALVGRDASMADHLAAYGRIDLALDTFPYNGATTTCDALLMGVPVASIAGDRAITRGGLSLLSTLGLSDWVGGCAEELVEILRRQTHDPQRLAALRAELPKQMLRANVAIGLDILGYLGIAVIAWLLLDYALANLPIISGALPGSITHNPAEFLAWAFSAVCVVAGLAFGMKRVVRDVPRLF